MSSVGGVLELVPQWSAGVTYDADAIGLGVTAIIDPATYPGGFQLLALAVSTATDWLDGVTAAVVLATTAPVTIADGEPLAVVDTRQPALGAFPMGMRVPPGYGLYCVNASATAGAGLHVTASWVAL